MGKKFIGLLLFILPVIVIADGDRNDHHHTYPAPVPYGKPQDSTINNYSTINQYSSDGTALAMSMAMADIDANSGGAQIGLSVAWYEDTYNRNSSAASLTYGNRVCFNDGKNCGILKFSVGMEQTHNSKFGKGVAGGIVWGLK